MRSLKDLLVTGTIVFASLLPTKAEAQNIEYFPPLDSKVNVFRQPNQSKPLVWDSLSTREQRIDSLKKYLAEDSTNEITPIPGKFESGNFARQLNINGYGTSGYPIVPGDSTFIYDTTNIERFNIPLYLVARFNFSNGKGHGMNAILVGDNPLNWNDWAFVEPQTDDIVQPGDVVDGGLVPISLDSNRVSIYQTHWNYNNRNVDDTQLFLRFFLKDGVVDSVWYDPKLILERNFAPEAFNLISPANGAQIPSCNDSIDFVWHKSVDRDTADVVKYKLTVKDKNTGAPIVFSNITDTARTLPSRTLTRGNFEWYVEASDGKEQRMSADTLEFIIRNTPPTHPTFINIKDNDTVSYDSGKLKIPIEKATDADEDVITYFGRFTNGTDPDVNFSTTADSIQINSELFKPLSKYTLEGRATDEIDTVNFTNSNMEIFTPLVTSVERLLEGAIPEKYSLSQNYPNPFNPQTKIRYSIEKPGMVSLKVYDLLGREVETLVNGVYPAGKYEADFNSSKLSSGVYFYRLQAGEFIETKKMVVNK